MSLSLISVRVPGGTPPPPAQRFSVGDYVMWNDAEALSFVMRVTSVSMDGTFVRYQYGDEDDVCEVAACYLRKVNGPCREQRAGRRKAAVPAHRRRLFPLSVPSE